MLPSASAHFPFRYDNENDCLKRTHTVEDMLLSALRIFLSTRKGSRLGNPIGSFLPDLLFQNVAVSALPGIAQELKTELIINFPGVDFVDVQMHQDLMNNSSDLVVKINFMTPNQQNMSELSMTLPSVFTPQSNLSIEGSY